MKNFDSRTYSINDFLEWHRNGQLELNPKFQRRNVWTERAKSYLIDTIIRGKPIPKVFIRQKLNPTTRTSIREVVDGQQRLRTILSYLTDGFMISTRHHETFGGLFFSQLGSVDPEIQATMLNYEISVDLLVNMPDAEVLDVFSRLNSYAVILNDQEKINATHFGPFKILCDRLGHEYHEFWVGNQILSNQQILRMGEVTLVADLIIAMLEGIRAKRQIKGFYGEYERQFDHDIDGLARSFHRVMESIAGIFEGSLATSEYRRIHQFYTLFTAVYHGLVGLPAFDMKRPILDAGRYPRIRTALSRVDQIYAAKESGETLDKRDEQFIEDSRRATTDAPVRSRRTAFVVELLYTVE